MTSVEFVEKALIGTLLNDSTRRDDVSWLSAEDFTNPLCQAIWRHLESGRPPQCEPLIDLVEMSEVLGRDYDLHAMLSGPAELATLQFQAPERPAITEYGRILVESTIRREVAAMGLRLESLATGKPEQIIGSVADTLASLESMHQRCQISRGGDAQVDASRRNASSPMAADASSWTDGSGNKTVAAVDDGMDHQTAEQAVIGAAVHDWPPGARAHVLENVRGSDFTNERAAATWLAVEHLAEHHAPIDEITVAWQALRACSHPGGGLTVQELRETRGAALFHEAGAATLARSTLTNVADQAEIAISRCAEDLRLDPTALIDFIATQHLKVAAAAQRLTGERLANAPLAAAKKTTSCPDAAIARDHRRGQRDSTSTSPLVVPR